MKKTIEERVKTKLYKLGKKNRICSVLVLPVLLVWVLFFRAVRYCGGNVKRFSMVAMTMVFFVVYSSFSFPMFIMAPEESAQLYGQDSVNNEVFLVEEEELNMEDVELLDDNEVLEEFDFNETSHGMTVVEKFDADEILRFTEDRASKSQDDSAGMNRIEEEFGETEAGIWLAENSYRYGFIVRYPKGKEYITGIGYEPWHFRYVGVEAATVITKNGITLEEFWEELE